MTIDRLAPRPAVVPAPVTTVVTPLRAPQPLAGFAPGMPVLQHAREPRQRSLDLRPRRA